MSCASVYGAVFRVHCGTVSGKVCYGWWVDMQIHILLNVKTVVLSHYITF
jgi:hypothetical protein